MVKVWFFLLRPWSYTATLVPFLVAAGFTRFSDGLFWGRWLLGLCAGLLLQATVNLLNTWGDEKNGVDNVPGAVRSTPHVHEGLVSLHTVFIVACVCATSGVLLGLSLCLFRPGHGFAPDYPLLIVGALGFFGATNYTTGIRFKYCGLGLPFVALLMGPIEIFAAAELLAPGVFPDFTMTIPVAALVGVILHGNDLRDIRSDTAAGIRTPATMLGNRGALLLYFVCHLLPYCFPFVPGRVLLLLVPLTARTLFRALRAFHQNPTAPRWSRLERDSGLIHLLYGILLSLSLAFT